MSNLGMQGSAGIMMNNVEIIKEKCRGYSQTVSDDTPEWLDTNRENTAQDDIFII